MIKSPALVILAFVAFVFASCNQNSPNTTSSAGTSVHTADTAAPQTITDTSSDSHYHPNILIDEMDISKLETPMSWQEKASKLKQVVEEFKTKFPDVCIPNDDWNNERLANFYSLFHFRDVNMDGIQDVLFNDALCADAEMPVLFLGTPTGFKKLISFPFNGNFAGINPNKDFTEIKLLEFTPCGYETLYNLKLKGMQLDTVYYAAISGVYLPSKAGIEKNVKTPKNTWLRFEPFKRDTGTTDLCEVYEGNRIMQLKKGTMLKVMAETKDKNGDTWYFVFAPGWKPKVFQAGWVNLD